MSKIIFLWLSGGDLVDITIIHRILVGCDIITEATQMEAAKIEALVFINYMWYFITARLHITVWQI